MQGKLNIFSSCWVYVILKWLTFLWYVVHVCSRRFTSLFIHCILYFMWLGFSHLFSCKCMYAGGVNLTSLLFMNIYRIYIFTVWFVFTPLLMIDIKGEKNSENDFEFICMFRNSENDLYMHVYLQLISYMHVYFYNWYMHICFCLCKRGESFFTYACLCRAFIAYLHVCCYAWVKGELLWSLTLIHAYITPWVLS